MSWLESHRRYPFLECRQRITEMTALAVSLLASNTFEAAFVSVCFFCWSAPSLDHGISE